MADQEKDDQIEVVDETQDTTDVNDGGSLADDQQAKDQNDVRTDDTDWKSQARKWESRSRANKQKIEELEQEIEQNKAS